MNGRLYDPLLRRFLNADENIQDPYNTQNYNKYGYVMNNPMMYTDPTGEFFWLAFLAVALKSVFWGAVVAGAIGGAIIGSALYLGQAAFTGNFSWGGFAKSFFMGALTGAVAGGLGQVFSSSGFWTTVGNGALAGAGSGGVTSLINGTNFLEGVLKGAVIGGAVGAISYGLGKLFTKKEVSYQTSDVNSNDVNNTSGGLKYNRESTDNWIQNNYKNELENIGYQGYKLEAPKGFFINDKGQFQIKPGYINTEGGGLAYAITDPSTNIIYLSPSAYSSNARFALSFPHELAHVKLNTFSYLSKIAQTPINTGHISLDNIGHFAIRYNEWSSANLNGFSFSPNLQNKITSSLNFFSSKAPSYYKNIWKLIDELKSIQVRTFKF